MQHALLTSRRVELIAAAPQQITGRWVWPALAAGLILLGFGLRLSLLARPGLHPDEALYAGWAARIVDGSDPALLGVYVDKPPLQLYLLAAAFRLGGAGAGMTPDFPALEVLGRLPGLLASTASLGLLYALGRQTYGRPTALLALALAAVSPLAVRLAPTLFPDPLLSLWILLAAWAAGQRRAWLTGIACGLAYATKQQSLLFIPLALAILLAAALPTQHQPPLGNQRAVPSPHSAFRILHSAFRLPHSPVPPHLRRFLYGFLLIVVLTLWWDSLRWQWMPSYWERSLATYGGLTLISPAAWPERAADWGELLTYAAGNHLLSLALAAGLPLVAWAALRTLRARGPGQRAARFDLLLVGFVASYLALHLALSFAPWDRYLLPLTPLLALLSARAASLAMDWLRSRPPAIPRRLAARLGGALLCAGLLHAAWQGAFGALPVGDARGFDGVAALASYLRASQPAGAVLYHHSLGWHYSFYLYGAPLELRWWETPAALAAMAADGRQRPQLIALPAGQDERGVRQELRRAGFELLPSWRARHPDGSPSLSLYTIRPVRVEVASNAY